jgi:uncharacterized protein YqeY
MLDTLNASLKEAMVAKDEFKTSVLRMIISAIRNKEIEKKGKGQQLTDDDVLDVLRKEVKKRKEASTMYQSAGRQESADAEERELQFIETFLPAQMPQEKIEEIVVEVLKEFSSPTQKDFGAIMKKVMAKVAGQADGSVVGEVIKKHLS